MQLVAIIIPILLVAFWLWMFHDMVNNDALPSEAQPGLKWPPEAKNQWMVFFILGNVFTAGFYFFTVYNR